MKKQRTYTYKNCSISLYKTQSNPCVRLLDCNNCAVTFPNGKIWTCEGASSLQHAYNIAIEKIDKTV